MTPVEKQVMMFSATLSKEVRPVCRKFMQDVRHPSNPSLFSQSRSCLYNPGSLMNRAICKIYQTFTFSVF